MEVIGSILIESDGFIESKPGLLSGDVLYEHSSLSLRGYLEYFSHTNYGSSPDKRLLEWIDRLSGKVRLADADRMLSLYYLRLKDDPHVISIAVLVCLFHPSISLCVPNGVSSRQRKG